MKTVFASLIILVSCAVASVAENKGTCPPSPPIESRRQSSKAQSGKITVQVVVSDTGYVCSAKVMDGIDKKSDAAAAKAVRQWHFVPAKKDGRPVPVVVSVEVQYQRDNDGNVILRSQQPTATEETPQAVNR